MLSTSIPSPAPPYRSAFHSLCLAPRPAERAPRRVPSASRPRRRRARLGVPGAVRCGHQARQAPLRARLRSRRRREAATGSPAATTATLHTHTHTNARARGAGGVAPREAPAAGLVAWIAGDQRAREDLEQGVAAVKLSCSGASRATCDGTLTLTTTVETKVKRKVKGHVRTVTETSTITLASARYSLSPNSSQTMKITLSRAGIHLLQKVAGHKVTAKGSAKPLTGRTSQRPSRCSPERWRRARQRLKHRRPATAISFVLTRPAPCCAPRAARVRVAPIRRALGVAGAELSEQAPRPCSPNRRRTGKQGDSARPRGGAAIGGRASGTNAPKGLLPRADVPPAARPLRGTGPDPGRRGGASAVAQLRAAGPLRRHDRYRRRGITRRRRSGRLVRAERDHAPCYARSSAGVS